MSRPKEVDQLFVLMTGKYRVSRNTRAQWYFNHLNQQAKPSDKSSIDEFCDEIEIVSLLPSDYQDLVHEDETGDSEQKSTDPHGPESSTVSYIINQNTKVTFLARRYRFAFILDLSPSMTAVDTQSNKVQYEEIFTALSRSLRGLAQPFYVPGSRLLFQPEIYVNVLAYSPFFTFEGQQVVAQGWRLTHDNVDELLVLLEERFALITESVSNVTAKANKEREERLKAKGSLNLDSLFNESTVDASKVSSNLMDATDVTGQKYPDTCTSSVGPTSSIPPDIAMVTMFRCGLMSLQLLPPQSSAGIVMISDGMLTLPSASVLENMLTQSRNHNISCSFLQVGSGSHPHSCFGYLPYTDLMKFITTATFGAYLDKCPEESQEEYNYSLYHRAFLAWNFQRGLHGFKSDCRWDQWRGKSNWAVQNSYFYSSVDRMNRFLPLREQESQMKDQQLVKTKLRQKSQLKSSFTSVLSCRLREGYTIKSVNILSSISKIEVTLILPWKHMVNIEYVLRAPWNCNGKNLNCDSESVECEVSFEGSYWFLHDITCSYQNGKIKSNYRRTATQQFWTTMANLAEADRFLDDLSRSFTSVPDSVVKCNSLFVLSPNSNELLLSSENSKYQQFADYWKTFCLLDINVWHKWMHTHRINLILTHDRPLPPNLHSLERTKNHDGRFHHVQCLNAMTALSDLLRKNSSFVMLENHSYIKFITIPTATSASSRSTSFFMIRVTTQLPCVVLHVAFIGGTSGTLRNQIVSELKDTIRNCKLPLVATHDSNTGPLAEEGGSALCGESTVGTGSGCPDKVETLVDACVLTTKAIDKILIRYKQVPFKFTAPFQEYYLTSQSCCAIVNPAGDANQHQQQVQRSFSQAPPPLETVDEANSYRDLQVFAKVNLAAQAVHAAADTLAILSRYFHHKRWIWLTSQPLVTGQLEFVPPDDCNRFIDLRLVPLVSALTKKRLGEGFHFAYNKTGMVNMIIEVQMSLGGNISLPCVIQYIIFPPSLVTSKQSQFASDPNVRRESIDGDECYGQVVTEYWIEPQVGHITCLSNGAGYMDGHDFKSVSEAILEQDTTLMEEGGLRLCRQLP